MRVAALSVVVCLAAWWIAASRAPAQSPQTQGAGPIPLAEVQARGIAGVLGDRLGKVITIHGVVVDGNTLGFKLAAGSLYLQADRVGERTLAKPVQVRLVAAGVDLKPGATVALDGYETGCYSGIVRGLNPTGRNSAGGAEYSFRTEFVVRQRITNN